MILLSMFFNIFNRKISLLETGVFKGLADCHSHILPGVDDGVKTFDESLRILKYYETAGVTNVWFTPHIMEDIPNKSDFLIGEFEKFKAGYAGSVNLNLSAEYMLDNLFEERLEARDLLPYGKDKNHILVETSYFNPPSDFHDKLSRIKSSGFYPVLAHPERYRYMSVADYEKLKSDGVRFQLNLFSLVGMYGETAKSKAEKLLKNRFYDLCGTDVHRFVSLDKILSKKALASSCTGILCEISGFTREF